MTPPSFEHQKIFAMMHFKLGDTLTTIHDMLRQLYAEKSATKAALQKWLRQYRAGDESIKDKRRAGRPPSASVDANIMQVAEIVQSDPSVSVTRIAKQMSIGRTVVHKILTNSLGMQKVNDKWVSKRTNKRARDHNNGVISSVIMDSLPTMEGDEEACDISEDDGGMVDEQVLQLGDDDVLGLLEDHLNEAHNIVQQQRDGKNVLDHVSGKRARFAFRDGVIEQIHDDNDDEDDEHHAAGHDELVEVLVFDPHVHGNLLNNADAFAEIVTDDDAQHHHTGHDDEHLRHNTSEKTNDANHDHIHHHENSLQHALHDAFLAGTNDAAAAAAAVEAAVNEIAAEQLKTQRDQHRGDEVTNATMNDAVNPDEHQQPSSMEQHEVDNYTDQPTRALQSLLLDAPTRNRQSQIAYLSSNIMLMSGLPTQAPLPDDLLTLSDSSQRLAPLSPVRATVYSTDSRKKRTTPKAVSKKKVMPKPLIFVKRPGQSNVEPLIL